MSYSKELWKYATELRKEGLIFDEIAQKCKEKFGKSPCSDVIRKKLRDCTLKEKPVMEQVREFKLKNEVKAQKKQEKQLIKELAKKEAEVEAIAEMKRTPQEYSMKATKSPDIDATAFIIASDWHAEELINSATVNQLNEFNLKIADERITRFFNNSAKLLKVTGNHIKITKTVLALLGDFISGNIHDELLETCQLRPIEAIIWVQERMIAGIKLLLKKTNQEFVIVCHVGNHTRITKTIHYSTEQGNALEYFMYHNLQSIFKDEKRIEFVIAEGYHSYLDVYGYTIRLHHGHAIRYGGGIGGLFIPAYKAISQWNKSRKADLDVFGHFHQLKNGGNFIVNGSLIGYNPYALRIKADFERPRQKFFLYTSNGEVTEECPIFLDEQ